MIDPIRPRNACARYAPELAAYADHSLSPQRADRVGGHVASCEPCLAEVAELRRVRELLGSHASQPTSAGLSSRLLSIAGDESGKPLWLQAGGDARALPSRRAQRVRRFRIAALSGTATALVVLTLALLMAPDLRQITDPARVARQDFSASVAALGMNEPVAAVLFALDRGARFERTTDIVGADASTAPANYSEAHLSASMMLVSAMQAEQRLVTARRPQQPVIGVQRVHLFDGEAYIDARVRVHDHPTNGVSVTVFDASGDEFLSGSVTASEAWSASPVSSNLDYYASDATVGTIAGRAVILLEARDEDLPVARWWLAQDDGMLLRSERYDAYGRVVLASEYESIDTASTQSTVAAAPSMALLPAANQQVEDDWCHGWTTCPLELASLPLVAYASSGPADATVMHLVYSDGLTTLSVVRQPGLLAPGGVAFTEYSKQDVPMVRAWQSGAAVVVVATNGSPDVVQAARSELPSEPAVRPDLWWRLGAGFDRLLGVGVR